MKNRIPFFNLKRQTSKIQKQIGKKFKKILKSCQFVCGREVEKFEQKFANYIGTKYCICVNNGTTALFLSLLANNIKEGDEVIVPVNTFIATAQAVSLTGAKPVFVDIDEKNYLINLKEIEEKITKKTKAIIPVHLYGQNLYGQTVNMEKLKKIAKKFNLLIIEDAAQAHGAEFKGKKAGSFGICGCFSFYPTKNLGCFGEGGAITTNQKNLAEKIKKLRNHGRENFNSLPELIGGNFRMPEIQAAILSLKLKFLEKWNFLRRKKAFFYKKLLKDLEKQNLIKLPEEDPENLHVYHLFVIRAKKRDALKKFLEKRGIDTKIHYPYLLHQVPPYSHIYKIFRFPIAEKISREILSLPFFPEITFKEIKFVSEMIHLFYKNA